MNPDIELREYARKRTRNTYAQLMSTPPVYPMVTYAYRRGEEVVIAISPPSEGIYGYAKGQSLGLAMFAYMDGLGPNDFLNFEELQQVRRAEEEIKMRNAREARWLETQAIADLIRKEQAAAKTNHKHRHSFLPDR
jgi:hypothetical protein